MVKLSDNCVYELMLFIFTWNVRLQYSYVGISYNYAIVCQSNHLCSLVRRPSRPAFVACSTNAEEGLVKLSHVV